MDSPGYLLSYCRWPRICRLGSVGMIMLFTVSRSEWAAISRKSCPYGEASWEPGGSVQPLSVMVHLEQKPFCIVWGACSVPLLTGWAREQRARACSKLLSQDAAFAPSIKFAR